MILPYCSSHLTHEVKHPFFPLYYLQSVLSGFPDYKFDYDERLRRYKMNKWMKGRPRFCMEVF